jgi:hypothetical protein
MCECEECGSFSLESSSIQPPIQTKSVWLSSPLFPEPAVLEEKWHLGTRAERKKTETLLFKHT